MLGRVGDEKARNDAQPTENSVNASKPRSRKWRKCRDKAPKWVPGDSSSSETDNTTSSDNSYHLGDEYAQRNVSVANDESKSGRCPPSSVQKTTIPLCPPVSVVLPDCDDGHMIETTPMDTDFEDEFSCSQGTSMDGKSFCSDLGATGYFDDTLIDALQNSGRQSHDRAQTAVSPSSPWNASPEKPMQLPNSLAAALPRAQEIDFIFHHAQELSVSPNMLTPGSFSSSVNPNSHPSASSASVFCPSSSRKPSRALSSELSPHPSSYSQGLSPSPHRLRTPNNPFTPSFFFSSSFPLVSASGADLNSLSPANYLQAATIGSHTPECCDVPAYHPAKADSAGLSLFADMVPSEGLLSLYSPLQLRAVCANS